MGVSKKLANISCKDYCDKYSYKYQVIENKKMQKIYIPNYENSFDKPNYENFDYPEKYVAELLDVKVIGGNDIIFDDSDNCIYDLALMEDAERYELAFNSVYYVEKDSTFVEYEESNEIFDEAIMLTGVVSNNYYHFNLQSLARLCLINTMDEYRDIPVLIDEIVLKRLQLYEELEMINKGRRKIHLLKSRKSYRVKKLIYISDLIIIPLNIKNPYKARYKDLVVSDIAVNLIHDNLAMDNKIYRKVFISRKDLWNKRLQNTEEVERVFEKFGYEIIYPEKISFMDQLIIFSQAEYVAGATGAAFTNMLFCSKDCTMICIATKDYEVPCFSNICGILGQKYYYLDAPFNIPVSDMDNRQIYESTFRVDVKEVEELLEKFHYKSGGNK